MHYSTKAYSIATRFTVAFSVMAALILPVGYFVVSYEYLIGTMETEAEINSRLISNLVNVNPELWRYETIRIEELLSRRPWSGTAETRRIFDNKNIPVSESVNDLLSPRVKVSYEIKDGEETVGRIEIIRSMAPLLLQSTILAIFGFAFGLILYRWLPFKDVIKTGKQLHDANEFLKKVMEGSTNSLVVLDLTGNIQMCNARFEALAGVPRHDLQGSSFTQLFTGDARALVSSELDTISGGITDTVTFETTFSRQDGLELSLFCGAASLLTEETVSGIIVSLDDITDRIAAEEERLDLERHLQQTQRLESLGVLAGGIAHDFNNILTIILGYCHVIEDDIDSTSIHADHILKIENAANRAADLCQQMLSYAGKSEMQRSQINMNMLVDAMVKMLHSGIKKNILIELDLCDALVIVADSSQIQQIVMNLIINSAEALGDANGTIRISLKKAAVPEDVSDPDFSGTAIAPGRYACLEVSDDGCGMDTETQRRIFEPFFTTKFAGRGLGMSSTLGIIKSHDGALQLSSKPGVGTTFRIYLPMQPEPDVAEQRQSMARTVEAPGNGTILLVDDEEELRVLGTITLNKIGYSTITAANGHEALLCFREHGHKIDLVLLDLLMPEMDGIETYHRLRDISPTIPIIFCSGCSKDELPPHSIDDERTRFLIKPCEPDLLRRMLFEMLA